MKVQMQTEKGTMTNAGRPAVGAAVHTYVGPYCAKRCMYNTRFWLQQFVVTTVVLPPTVFPVRVGIIAFFFKAEGRLRLTLVDHNAVSGVLRDLGDSVIEIVDHHMDLEEHPSVRGASRDIAFDVRDGSRKALVGSCCTIVAERMLDQAPTSLSSDVARLLLGVVRKRKRRAGVREGENGAERRGRVEVVIMEASYSSWCHIKRHT